MKSTTMRNTVRNVSYLEGSASKMVIGRRADAAEGKQTRVDRRGSRLGADHTVATCTVIKQRCNQKSTAALGQHSTAVNSVYENDDAISSYKPDNNISAVISAQHVEWVGVPSSLKRNSDVRVVSEQRRWTIPHQPQRGLARRERLSGGTM